MGADLYIEKLTSKAFKKYNPLFNKAVMQRNALEAQCSPAAYRIAIDVANGYSSAVDHPKAIVNSDDYKLVYKAQKQVSKYLGLSNGPGYFRDSYNGTSLLNRLGLSWWTDVGPMQNKDGYLTLDNIKKLKDMVKNAKLPLYTSQAEIDAENLSGTPIEWNKYFTEKRKKFIAYLNRALKLKEKIACSI